MTEPPEADANIFKIILFSNLPEFKYKFRLNNQNNLPTPEISDSAQRSESSVDMVTNMVVSLARSNHY